MLGDGAVASVFAIDSFRLQWMKNLNFSKRVDSMQSLSLPADRSLAVKVFKKDSFMRKELYKVSLMNDNIFKYTDLYVVNGFPVIAKISEDSLPEGYCEIALVKYRGTPLDKLRISKDPITLTRSLLKTLTFGPSWLKKSDLFHNDIKPDNLIVLRDETVVLTDFDVVDNTKNSTFDDQCFGTWQYMCIMNESTDICIKEIFGDDYIEFLPDNLSTQNIRNVLLVNTLDILALVDPIARHNLTIVRTLFWILNNLGTVFDTNLLQLAIVSCHDETLEVMKTNELVTIDRVWAENVQRKIFEMNAKKPKKMPVWRGGDNNGVCIISSTLLQSPSEEERCVDKWLNGETMNGGGSTASKAVVMLVGLSVCFTSALLSGHL